MGVVECLNHHLVEPYNVLYEKEGEVRLLLYDWSHSLVHLRVRSVCLPVLILSKSEIRSATNQWLLKLHSRNCSTFRMYDLLWILFFFFHVQESWWYSSSSLFC